MMEIKIGDKTAKITPFDLNDNIAIEEKFERSIGKLGALSMKEIRYLVWFAVRKQLPDITEEAVGASLDLFTKDAKDIKIAEENKKLENPILGPDDQPQPAPTILAKVQWFLFSGSATDPSISG